MFNLSIHQFQWNLNRKLANRLYDRFKMKAKKISHLFFYQTILISSIDRVLIIGTTAGDRHTYLRTTGTIIYNCCNNQVKSYVIFPPENCKCLLDLVSNQRTGLKMSWFSCCKLMITIYTNFFILVFKQASEQLRLNTKS